jgi:DNA-binding SARP family transcriptional activator
MSSGSDTTLRAAIPAWGRALLALFALAGLSVLVLLRPRLPAMPWQPLQPTGDELLRECAAVVLWLLLLFFCLRLGWLALKPPRILKRVVRERPSWLPAERPARAALRSASSRQLLELFSRPHVRGEPLPVVAVAATVAAAAEAARPEAGVALALLGRQRVGGEGKVASERATRGLIAYLATKRSVVSLDELCEALWPGDNPAKTRQRLWKAKRQAQRLLGDALVREHDSYRLERGLLRLDADELERLRSRPEWDRGEFERANALVSEEPLADVNYSWADGERRRLQAIQLELLERIARKRLEDRDGSGALAAAERLVELDPLNERGWCLAMEAEALLGNRQAVLDRYEQLARMLDERLGLRPSGDAKSLYRRLLAQN